MSIWLLFRRGSLNHHGVEIEKTLSPKGFSPLHLRSRDALTLKLRVWSEPITKKCLVEMSERPF